MKKFVAILILLSVFLEIASADVLILSRKGYSTYIQLVEYPLSEGINDIGPITLKPFADIRGLRIEGKGLSIVSYIIKNSGENWQDKLLGKYVEIKGRGKSIKGRIVKIDGEILEIDAKKGYVLTTLPKFPARLVSPLKWKEIYSPQIDVRIKSNAVKTGTIKLIYPVKNLNWKPEYILKNDILEIYITLINNSPVSLEGVDIKIKGFYKSLTLRNKTLERFSVKRIKVYSGKLSKIVKKLHGSETIAVYQGDQFIGYKKLRELFK